MAKTGAQPGNQNARKAKIWTQAIENALRKRSASGRMAALEELAEKLLQRVEEGDMQALKELGDRLEGKPNQSVEMQADTKVEISWKE